ncbi:hypothetical protein GCM10009775_00510 [Microbacterium aoyamense]|uniref:Dioxygenase n=1 Tax=Microbacterium aoyamense TaxID=344166 RepID=A0ABP5AK37_9MICO|nr:dioxygenase [Microbacterium aoyamense]
MSGGGKDRTSREARERARLYDARRALHEGQARRRSRDNLIAGIAGGVIIVAIAAAQTLYFTTGPGAPVPTPTPTSTTTPSVEPSVSPTPEPTTTP